MEHDMNNADINYIPLQDIISSGYEQLEKNQDVGQKTDFTNNKSQTDKRKRISGAARRRYKKQRQLMAQALQNQNPPPISAISVNGFKEVNPLEVTSATSFKAISPLEATLATISKEVSPPETTSVIISKKVSPPETTSVTDPKEVNPSEATSATSFKEISPLEATLAISFKEINPLEATSVIISKEVSPLETTSVTEPKKVNLSKATSAIDPKEVSPPEATFATGFKEVDTVPPSEFKRPWSMLELTTLLSNGYSAVKKLKIQHIEQSSYIKTENKITLKVALILEGFPKEKLNVNDISILKRDITRRILDMDESIKAPTFTGMWNKDGAIIIHCVDEYSKDWLKNISHELNIRGIYVLVVPAEVIFKRHQITVHVTNPEISIEEILKLFDRQNKGLAAEEWVVAKKSERKDAMRIHFIAWISDSSLEALKAINFKPYCGLVRATIKLSNSKEENNTFMKQYIFTNEGTTNQPNS